MNVSISLVQRVQIASPCSASWAEMAGDERVRFCSLCKLNVYNLSAMRQEEGERLILEKEGRLCARIYRRSDGTIVTSDCPVGLAAIRRTVKRHLFRVAAALTGILSAAAYAVMEQQSVDDEALAQGIFIYPEDYPPEIAPYGRTLTSLSRWLNADCQSRTPYVGAALVIPSNVSGQ